MKKGIGIIVCLLANIILVGGCSNKEQLVNLNEFLVTEGIALTCEMDELAESKDYLAIMMASDETSNVIEDIANQDYSIPKNVYISKLSDEMLHNTISNFSDTINITDNIMDKLRYKVNSATYGNIINANYGVDILSSAIMISWEKSYLEPSEWSDNILLFFEYDGGFSSIVSFTKSGDGVISGSSVFVKNGETDVLPYLEKHLGINSTEFVKIPEINLKDILSK